MIRLIFCLLCGVALVPGLAQVNDDFSDGDFTNNPTWSGDVALFQVNAQQELQSAGNTATETIYLSTPSTRVNGTEWRCQLRYLNNPSSSNNLRIYLVSDQADLTGALNGYFLTAGGESGSDDSYDLYRQDGNSETLLIDGSNGLANPTDATLRVLRDGAGNWSLAVDQGSNGIFLPQGNANDATHLTSLHMGVVVSHTSTRADAYFVDNVYVGDEIIDTDPPQVLSAEALSDSEVTVAFDEPLDQASAFDIMHYSLDQGIGQPASAQFEGGDPTRVRLTFGTLLTNQTQYQLTVRDVADLSGNAIDPAQTVGFLYLVPDQPELGDVIFNEFFPDPTPSQGLPEEEFVELYNRSNKVIDLDGWTFSDASSTVTLPAHLLLPGEYIVITATADVPLFDAFGEVVGLSSLPALNNGGDDLILRTSNGAVIDSLTYTTDWYQDESRSDGGFTLELINPENEACPAPANWRASEASIGGTPGSQNSVFSLTPETDPPGILSSNVLNASSIELCFDEIMDPASLEIASAYSLDQGIGVAQIAEVDSTGQCVRLSFDGNISPGTVYSLSVGGVKDCSGNLIQNGTTVSVALGRAVQPFDVVINELLVDPTPVVGLPAVDFLELYNRSEEVLDISRFRISDASGEAQWGSAVLFPGEYLLICDDDAAPAFESFGRVIGVSGFPNFNNAGDSVILRNEFDEVIDYVFYSDDWYRDEARNAGGFTLERIDPDFVDCNQALNWQASEAAIGGTPGQLNTANGDYLDEQVPVLDQALALDSQTVLLFFSEPMDRSTLENEVNYELDQGIGTPDFAQVNSVGNQAVSLRFATALQPNLVYTLSVNGVADCAGNLLNASVQLGLTASPEPFDLVFNEILADPTPAVGLPEAEFIELYNRTDKLLDLREITVSDGGAAVDLGIGSIFPGETIILCDPDDEASFRPLGRTLAVNIPALGNSSDSLILRLPDGRMLDYLYYSDAWYGSIEAGEGGRSLERIDPDFVDCNNAGNWRASEASSGGTPGQPNSIQGDFNDTESPQVLTIRPTDNGIEIEFDEQMDPAQLEEVGRYQADGGLGTPILAMAEAPHFRRVELVFALPLDTNRAYTLQINDLGDCVGNLLTTTVPFGLAIQPQPGELLINEILFNPYTGGADFVEVVNASDNLLDLSTLRIAEGVPGTDTVFNDFRITEESYVLLPGQLVCLTAQVLFQRLTYRPPLTARFLEVDRLPSYDDREGECVIFTDDSAATQIDRFFYLDDYHYPTLEEDDGVSLERISLQVPTQEPDNWHSASSLVGYATPGYENSQAQALAQGDSEVSLGSQVFSPNLDGDNDVLAINYQFDFVGANARVYVYDTRGHLVRRLQENILLDPAPGTFFWDGFGDGGQKLPIGMYVILFEVTNNDTGERRAFRRVAVLADQL